MSKKLLSVLLAILMVVSSVSCLFTATTLTASAEGENLMANIKASDWKTSSNGNPGVDVALDGIAVNAGWHSAYIKVALNPEAKHTFSFSFAQVRIKDVKVYPASEINPETDLINPSNELVIEGTNLASAAITTELASGTPVDGKFYKAEETFTTTTETEYYIILDGAEWVSSTSVILKDISLVEHPYDPNVLNDGVMAGLTWNAIWSSGFRNPKTADLDKSQSYSTEAYAMTWGGNSVWRSNYTTVTLKPNTTYDFSFYFKSSAEGKEYINQLGFVDANKVDFTTAANGEYIDNYLTDSSTPILGKDNATLGTAKDGTWNLAKTTFTTTDATEYVLYFNSVAGATFSALTLSDFNLVEMTTSDLLNNYKAWDIVHSTMAGPADGTSGEAAFYQAAQYQSIFTKVTLEANTNYTLNFNFKGVAPVHSIFLSPVSNFNDGFKAANGNPMWNATYVKDKNLNYVGTYSADATTADNYAEYKNATAGIKTGNETEYYLIIHHDARVTSDNSGNFNWYKDFSLEKSDNLLAGTAAADWIKGWTGTAGTAESGVIKLGAAWRSVYTKVTLQPGTKYDFSFNHSEVKVTDIRVFAASEITDPATQLINADTKVDGGTNNLATDSFITTCPAKPVAGEFYTSSEIFTTGTETEYYIIIDCGDYSTTAILLKNLSLKALTPADLLSNPASWKSTATITATKATESENGNPGVTLSHTFWRDSFVELELEPNTNYNLSFNYKGNNTLAFVEVIQNSLITNGISGDRVSSNASDMSQAFRSNQFTTVNDNATWNNISVDFTTKDDTIYYLVLVINGGGTSPATYTVSDINLAKDAGIPAGENILANITKDDWTSAWDNTKGYTPTVMSVINAWRSAYTMVTLAPNTNYEFTFSAANVKASNVRVYAASEITDVANGGTNNLVSYYASTAPADDYATADANLVGTYYNVSANFATTDDTEYYIYIDGTQFRQDNPNNTSMYLKNLSLISKGEVYIDPNVLNDTAMAGLTWYSNWEGSGLLDPKLEVLDKSQSYSGEAYAMTWAPRSRYRSNHTYVTLEPNTTYTFSFYFKSSETGQEYIDQLGFIDASKLDFTTLDKGRYIEGYLIDSSTPILGKDNATLGTAKDGTWNLAKTTFTTTNATEYVLYLNSTHSDGCTFSALTLSDFDLREYVDPNKLIDATVANGDVRWSVGDDSAEDYITGAEGKEDELVTYTNGAGEEVTSSRVYYYDELNPAYNYNGGYAWRIIISNDEAMHVYNPAVYGYITAKGLAANTKYTFSYIYTDTYHVKLADIYNVAGSVADIDVTTKMLPTKEGATAHSYMVTATFTTGDEGDYTIKLQTGRSNKYYIYGGDAWAMTVSDLSLTEYEETETVVIPDDANLLENPEELPWKATWSTINHSTNGYNGTKAISLGGIQYHALYTRLDTLAPNTEYTLTFKYKSTAAIDLVGITDAANVNLANVNDKFSSTIVKNGNIVYYANVEKVIDATTWNNATVKFVTGDSATYYLYFEGNSAANSAVTGGITISDMSLTKVLDTSNAIVVDYDFENGTIGAVSTTSGADVPSIAEEGENKYLKFTRKNDGITVPFYYRANQKYVVSFDMKVLSYPTEKLQFRFRTSEGDNNPISYEGNVFTYNNNAYSLVTKDLNGNLLSGPAGLNNSDNYQFNGYKQDIANHTDWVHYEITIDPDYTYYTGLANFGFDAGEAGWSIALDNIKVAALNEEFEADAEAKFEPTKYAAIRAKSAEAYQGIRVKSSIDTSLLAGDIKVVEYGTLAINNSKLGGKELVYDMVNSATYGAKLGVAYSADNGTNVIFEQEGNVVTFTGTLIGLKDYTTDYAVRGYMIAETADGERFVIYEEDTKTVSVYDVVYAILNDGVTNDDDTVAEAIVSKNQAEYDSFVEENYAEEVLTTSKKVNLSVQNNVAPVINNYRGFSGTVYHAFGFMEDDVTGRVYDADMINTELDRLQDAGVHYLRTRYQSQWIFDDATGYDWNSDRFNYFLNYARALQERDMEVILQVGWHFDFISRQENATYSIHENDYFNGEGADRYGESTGVAAAAGDTDNARIIRAAYRYAYLMANTVKVAKAQGINNIKYFSYFVEPSNSYSVSEDGSILDKINLTSGHDKEQYVLFCRTMRDAVEDIYNVTDVKHMGPNEAGYSKLTNYVLQNDPTLFDIITAHNYPEEGDVATNYNKYYETMTDNQNYNALNGYMTDFNDYKGFLATAKQSNANAEFWSDEFNIKDFDAYQGRGTSSFYRGLATAMGGIVAQQSGIQNTILWMSYDQLWTDKTGGTASTNSEFMNGIHQCGNAPSLFLSDQPYAQYYPTTLFSKYNGYKNGTVYKTTLANNGVYIGAVKLEDGSWTVSVLNMNDTAVEITVDFKTAINQTLYRHVVSADKADTYADAKIPDADKTFTNVAASFNDVLPAGSFAVYTGVK